jgi:hypothetical protein
MTVWAGQAAAGELARVQRRTVDREPRRQKPLRLIGPKTRITH